MSDEAITILENMRAAWRQRLAAIVRLSVGPLTDVSAAGQTYSRASGSFITDGFRRGEEVLVAGMGQAGNNGRALITEVAALTLKTGRALTTETAGASATLSIPFPEKRAWEGEVFTPVVGRPFIDEKFSPVSERKRAVGGAGVSLHLFSAAVTLKYPAGYGTAAIEKMAGAIVGEFYVGSSLSYGGQTGLVTISERRGLQPSADWIICPVLVTVQSWSARTA